MRSLKLFGVLGFFLFALPVAAQPNIAGVWGCMHGDGMGGSFQTQLVLQPTGSYSQQSRHANGSLLTHWGTWRQGENYIRLTLQGHEPREACGPAFCSPIQMPEGETWWIQRATGTTLYTNICALQRQG